MLRDGTGFKKAVLICGRVDLRKGIDGLAAIVRLGYNQDCLEEGTLFLFCGISKKKIRGLLYEGDGFLLVTKRLSNGYFCFPRTPEEAKALTADQYRRLMDGFSIDSTIH